MRTPRNRPSGIPLDQTISRDGSILATFSLKVLFGLAVETSSIVLPGSIAPRSDTTEGFHVG